MKDLKSAVDVHGYIDNCLSPEARKAFEAQLRQDEDLRRRVELWQAQSDAIRAAFGAPGRSPRASGLRGNAPRSPSPGLAGSTRGAAGEFAIRSISPSLAAGRTTPQWRSWLRGPATRAALLLAFVTLFPDGMSHAPRRALGEAGAAAFRAFSVAPTAALDIRGGGGEDLAQVVGPQFVAAGLPEWIAPSGWTLRGAKRVPGLQGEAVLILLEGKGGRPLGVLVEPLDAPTSSAIRSEPLEGMTVAAFTRRGYGFAIVGQADGGVEAWLSASGLLNEGRPQPIR